MYIIHVCAYDITILEADFAQASEPLPASLSAKHSDSMRRILV